MIRFLLGFLLILGAVDWIDRGNLINAGICVLLGFFFCVWGVWAINYRLNDDEGYGP